MFSQYQKTIEAFLARYSIPSPWGVDLFDAITISAGILSLLFFMLFALSNRSEKKKDQKDRPPRALIRKAKKAEKKANYLEAGELYMAAGHFKEAAQSFVEVKEFGRAAEACLMNEDYSNAAQCLVRSGDKQRAAEYFIKARDYISAAENLLEVGNKNEAANLFLRGGDNIRAAEVFSSIGFLQKAGELLAGAEENEKAAPLLIRTLQERVSKRHISLAPEEDAVTGNLSDLTATVLLRSGQKKKAAQILEMGGKFGQSAAIFEELGDRIMASDLYIRAKDTSSAARVLEASDHPAEGGIRVAEALLAEGKSIEAAELFMRIGELKRGAELFLEGGLKDLAIEAFSKSGDYIKSAELLVEMGKSSDAAKLLMEAGHAKEAAAIYKRMGQTENEVEALIAAGSHFQAGRSLLDLGKKKEATETLQKVDDSSADYKEANQLLGDLFFEQKQWSLAISNFQKALGDENVRRDNLDSFYHYAGCLKEDGQLQGAVSLFEKILLVDYHYRDVKDQVQSLKAVMAASTPGAGAGQMHTGPDATIVASSPQKKSRYQMIDELGRGGMGVVYRAKDTLLDRIIAYKVLPPQVQRNQNILDMFLREAKSAAKLSHPNIVTIFDADQDRGEFFIIMEIVEGNSLKELLEQQGKFPLKTALVLIGQVMKALSYAHSRGVVHRDIKPANLLWSSAEKLVKITDFGLARVIEEGRGTHTQMAGTPYYMAPEQILGGKVDHRADLYALGVTLYEFLTGTVPFKEGDVLYHHVHTSPPPPETHDPGISKPISDFILKFLEKESTNRYHDVDTAIVELRKLLL